MSSVRTLVTFKRCLDWVVFLQINSEISYVVWEEREKREERSVSKECSVCERNVPWKKVSKNVPFVLINTCYVSIELSFTDQLRDNMHSWKDWHHRDQPWSQGWRLIMEAMYEGQCACSRRRIEMNMLLWHNLTTYFTWRTHLSDPFLGTVGVKADMRYFGKTLKNRFQHDIWWYIIPIMHGNGRTASNEVRGCD